MRKICIVLFFTCSFFSFSNVEQSVHNLPTALQKNDKHPNPISGKKHYLLRVSKTRPLPTTFVLDTNLDKLPVIKLQVTDSAFIVDEQINELASKNPESSTFSKTLPIIGGLVFFLGLLFFIVRKQKQSKIKKQQAHDVLAQQPETEIQVELFENPETEIDNSKAIETLSAEYIDLHARLVTYYKNEKPYLNANLKAVDVAKALNISPRTITAILKANGFNGFNNFNNKYRVEEVIRQFEDPNYSSIKMEIISSNAGFGNRQTFYTAFEEFTGLNPGFYRSEFLKQ